MRRDELQRLYDYHYWANHRVWDCATKLSEAQLHEDLHYSLGSIHRQLVHLMDVEWFWLSIIRGTLPEDTDQWNKLEDFPTLDLIHAKWQTLEMEIRTYLSDASEDELNRIIYHPLSTTIPRPSRVWEALFYVATHGVDHRAQILAGIHRLGGETVMQDLIVYVWETGLNS